MRKALSFWWSTTLSRGWRMFMSATVVIYAVGIPLSIAFDRYDLAVFLSVLFIATFGTLLYLIRTAYPGRRDSFS